MTQDHDDMSALDSHFAAARNTGPTPSPGLLARIMDDAQAVQDKATQAAVFTPATPGLMRQLFQVLGGWPAMGGLGVAAMAGLWLGISPPLMLQNMTDGYLGPDATAYLIDTSADVALGLSEEAM